MAEPTSSTTPRAASNWHLDKTISVTHLLTTMTIVFSAFVWANKQDARLTQLEEGRKTQAEVDKRQDQSLAESLGYIRGALVEIKSDVKELREARK